MSRVIDRAQVRAALEREHPSLWWLDDAALDRLADNATQRLRSRTERVLARLVADALPNPDPVRDCLYCRIDRDQAVKQTIAGAVHCPHLGIDLVQPGRQHQQQPPNLARFSTLDSSHGLTSTDQRGSRRSSAAARRGGRVSRPTRSVPRPRRDRKGAA